MIDQEKVASHYTHGDLLGSIATGLAALGKTPETATVDDLAPVDEFHIGGRAATERFLDRVGLAPEDHVLDVGCGLGGASRFAASRYGCRMSGIDLTAEYVATGNSLCAWLGLEARISLEVGDATATPFAEASFDKAYMLHVGMNIADKTALAAELHRVLKPGGTLGIYDIMATGAGELAYPVPWAQDAAGSALGAPADYRTVLEAAGFKIESEENRRGFALDFFDALRAKTAAAGGPPPLGLHILMGESAPAKLGNMIDNINAARIAPVELIATKAG